MNRAEFILSEANTYRARAYEAVEQHEKKSRLGRWIARFANPEISEQMEFIQVIESVPAARLAAAREADSIIT